MSLTLVTSVWFLFTSQDSCIKDRNPPQEHECAGFFSNNSGWKEGGKYDEAMIISGSQPIICNPDVNPEIENFGWCHTKGDYYNMYQENPLLRSWGFCSKDCFLSKNSANGNVLRHVPSTKVLDEELCQKYLLQATNNGNVKVMPKILCVADTFPWKVAVWENKGGQFKKVTGSKSKEYLKKYHYGAKYAPEGYVASAGTCRGDSGGPLYITENNLSTSKKSYIVLGVVSGGRGKLGNCGGINNPVHYVRVKKFTEWIITLLGNQSSEVCWDQKFTKKIGN